MGKRFTVHEALRILRDHHITESLQMVVRWIREDKLRGTRTENRKDGYLIEEDHLYEFITERAPGMVQLVEVHQEYLDKIVFNPKETSHQIRTTQETSVIEERMRIQEENISKLTSQLEFLKHEVSQDVEEQIQQSKVEIREMLQQEFNAQNNTLKDLMSDFLQKQKQSSDPAHEEEPDEEDDEDNHCTWDEFQKMVYKQIPNEKKEDREKMLVDLQKYYDLMFTDGRIKSNLISGTGKIKCPLTNVQSKYIRTLFKKTIPEYFKKHTDKDTPVGNEPKAGTKMKVPN
jgi:hypothetical protein